MKILCEIFIEKNILEEIYLDSNSINENGLYYLNDNICKSIYDNHLEIVSLKNNMIKSDGMYFLEPSFTHKCYNIKYLNFDSIKQLYLDNLLGDEGMDFLKKILCNGLNNLEILSLIRIINNIRK